MPPKPPAKTPPKSSKSSARPSKPLAPQMAPAYRSKNAPRTIKRQTVVTRSRDPNTKLAQETRTTYENPYVATTRKPGQASAARKRGIGGGGNVNKAFSPLGKQAGIGLLEAEFFLTIIVLVLIMFTSKAAISDKIMSTIKRGTLTCVAFFVLALIASIGDSAAMVAKAVGALIVASVLLTAPIVTVNKDFDALIKNDWVASNTEASSQAADQTQNQPNALNNPAATNLGAAIQGIIAGLTGGATTGGTNAKAFAAGIIQGLKSVFGL